MLKDQDLVNALRKCSGDGCNGCPQYGKYGRLDSRCINEIEQQAADALGNAKRHVEALMKEIEALRAENERLRLPPGETWTNGGRVRAMNDEELATVIMCPYDGEAESCRQAFPDMETCVECCVKWLRKPAEETKT